MRLRVLSSLCLSVATLLFSMTFGFPEVSHATENTAQKYRRISLDEYRDKMAAGWIGQMVGVGWGDPTEFRFNGRIIPQNKVPRWKPELVNQFSQDDIYVEMTFLATLERYGFDVSIRQAGIDFGNSRYNLWHANKAGRDNIRKGIAPPDSGHPKFNSHADDIDYQIEADYAGLISPGMPNLGIELGEKFGRLMNYGDGVYGGQFISGMYAEAFFETDPRKIVEAGLKCIPAESQYAEAIRDVLAWHTKNPDDWQATWKKINDKYQLNPAYRRFSCTKLKEKPFNIDAKINGAYIVTGLLYGISDLDKTIVISMRCGQDSDCNPSNAGGVLATSIGRKKLPTRFTSALNPEPKFSHTSYNFPGLLEVCEKLARKAVIRGGGRIEHESDGGETFVIPLEEPRPGKLKQCWNPSPPTGSVYSSTERAKIEIVEK
ncbi:MAG: ADP-ribosylglycohydrolase family protein [Pirellulales bacterium]|nr:ADP-ribosylglycohydrolase family protein [Pirellulales bacterium]